MGAFLSLAGSKSYECDKASRSETCNKRRISSIASEECQRLIPNLPDELSLQILARVPRIDYLHARLVSQRWKKTLTSPEVYCLRKELGTAEEWLYLLTKGEDDKLLWHALDPAMKIWQRLPQMPDISYEEAEQPSSGLLWSLLRSNTKIAGAIKGWLGGNDTTERQVPYLGCAAEAVDGCLYVLGGFSKDSTLKSVWKFDPMSNAWSEEASMSTGRAYCKTGIVNNKLYVVGGVSKGQGGLTPIQSAETFDPKTGTWSEIQGMPFSQAQVHTTPFLAEAPRPIATGMTPYKGKLCVPQSLYLWPFFVDVGGEIYDPETDSWAEMPAGMGDGWPARQIGTKISVVVDGELYAFDPSISSDNGKIMVYNHEDDAWEVVIGEVPSYESANSESPYLLAALHGKLQFITGNSNHEIEVRQADISRKLVSSIAPPNPTALPNADVEPETKFGSVVWKTVACRQSEWAELVSCQVLNL